MEWAEGVGITLAPLPSDLRAACARHLAERAHFDAASTDRAIVSMLRHAHTNYHALLDAIRGEVGRWEAYKIIRRRVNEAVCAAAGIACTPEVTGDDEDAAAVGARWGEAPREG